MMKGKVLIPFGRMTKSNGFESYTEGDIVELDALEARQMAEAGMVKMIDVPVRETAEIPDAETAEAPKVRRGKVKQ